jgi:PAS domain-containing protein
MTWLVVLLAAAAAALGAYGWSGRRHAAEEVARVNLELARRLRELFSLQELSYLLSESLQLDRIVDQVARYLMRFLDAQGAMVVLAVDRAGDLRVAAAEGSLAPLAGRVVAETEAALVGTAMVRQKLELAQGSEVTAVLAGVAARRVAIAPLRAHGMTAGAIVSVDPPEDFGADRLRLLSTVATHAAVVLTNARFLDQLRAGKQQWESTFDALADGVALVDVQGRVQRANQALARLLRRRSSMGG